MFNFPSQSKTIQIPDIKQGSSEWLELRAGMISASRMCSMMAEGDGITRGKYRTKLAIERMIGHSIDDGFKSKHIERGNQLEPAARDYYEIMTCSTIEQVPFIRHPTINAGLASPDALVDDDGMLEIKCPAFHTHVEYLRTRKIPRVYMLQMYFQMACTGRKWVDWMSYCPELPENIRALIIRVPRNEKEISALENETIKFDREINELIKQLREM